MKFGLFLVFVGIFTSEILSQNSNFEKVQLILVNTDNPATTQNFSINNLNGILTNRYFRYTRRTVLYAFGYNENLNSNTTLTLIKAYADKGGYNILVVDWSAYNQDTDFLKTIPKAQGVGQIVGSRIKRPFAFLLGSFEFVGFSMGAHLMAYISREITTMFFKIPKIVALDPAGIYMNLTNSKPLTANDAKVVVVIHTDTWYFGSANKLGTVDFYPNGGYNQTGCPPPNFANPLGDLNNFCSHKRSVYLFAESLTSQDRNAFTAVQCENWVAFILNRCSNNPRLANFNTRMFMSQSELANATYHLQTNSKSLYNRGLDGVNYNSMII